MPQFTGIWSLTEAQGAVRNQNWPGIVPPIIEYLIVAGGGGGSGGGGGAGGLLAGQTSLTQGTQIWVTVGSGGALGTNTTSNGGYGTDSVLVATSSGANTGNFVTSGGGGGAGGAAGTGAAAAYAGNNGGSGLAGSGASGAGQAGSGQACSGLAGSGKPPRISKHIQG